jgi:hypothetical protein
MAPREIRSAIIPALMLLLAACTPTTQAEKPAVDSPEQAPAMEAALPSAPPPAPPKPMFDPDIFLGLTVQDLEDRYGAPRLKRGEGVARVWQYVEGDCVLHLFLYAGGEEGDQKGFRVEHVETKLRAGPDNPDVTAAEACAGPFGVIRAPDSAEAATSADDPAGGGGNPAQ